MHFLKYAKKDQAPPSSITDKYLLDAYKTLERFNWTREEFDAYDRARLRREIEEDNREEVYQEGIEKGRQESQAEITKAQEEAAKEKQEKHRVIQGMLQENMDISLIMKLTDLTEDALNDLRKG